MKDILILCLLRLIERQRYGEQISEDLVKNVINSYSKYFFKNFNYYSNINS